LPATTPTDWSAAYGGTPSVPSPGATAAETTTANLANLANLYNMAGGINAFNLAQVTGQYQAGLPNYSALMAQSSRNIASHLAGEVAPDVVSELIQSAAERGVATGQGPMSPNVNAAYLRALGLTSHGLQAQGEQEFTGAIGRIPRAPLFDISSGLVSPSDWMQAQLMANIYAAAPTPSAAAGASEAAARRGLGAGAGAVGAPGISRGFGLPSYSPTSWFAGAGPETIVAPSTATTTMYGGVPYEPGTSPETAGDAWSRWASSLSPTTDTGGWGSFFEDWYEGTGGPGEWEFDTGEEFGPYPEAEPAVPSEVGGGFEDWETMLWG